MREVGALVEKDAGDSFAVSFLDTDGAAAIPTTVEYRIDCMTNGVQILDWTAVTAAATVTITLTATATAIVDDDNEEEMRRITVCVDRNNATSQKTNTADFFVLNSNSFPPIVP